VPPAEFCSHELASRLVELSGELRRQIGILVNRAGIVEYVIVGDEKGLVIPDLRDYPLGKRVMRGLRLIHTHLKNEPLSEDDLTDLSLLRLDLLASLLFTPGKPHISAQLAWLSPDQRGSSTVVETPKLFDRIDLDCGHFIPELEADLEKASRTATRSRDALERAILISVTTSGTRQEAEDSMAELRELARTAQVEALDEFIQRPRSLNPRFLMGEGKMRDVVIRALQHGASMLIFDQELTPAQIRSISAMTELKVIDRSQLILDIFARRAKTLDGKVQVELAQLKYLLPRLTGRGVQMSRLMGGIGGRGPGETKLEVDAKLFDSDPNKNALLMDEVQAHANALMNEMADCIIYGKVTTEPKKFNGLINFYSQYQADSSTDDTVSSHYVFNAKSATQASTAALRSIFLVGWSQMSIRCFYPQGTMGGIQRGPFKKYVDVTDSDGGTYEVHRQYLEWQLGLDVRDYRYGGRMCNLQADEMFDTTGVPDYWEILRRMTTRVRDDGGVRQVFYMDKLTWEAVTVWASRKTAENAIKYGDLNERIPHKLFGINVRIADSLNTNEDEVSQVS